MPQNTALLPSLATSYNVSLMSMHVQVSTSNPFSWIMNSRRSEITYPPSTWIPLLRQNTLQILNSIPASSRNAHAIFYASYYKSVFHSSCSYDFFTSLSCGSTTSLQPSESPLHLAPENSSSAIALITTIIAKPLLVHTARRMRRMISPTPWTHEAPRLSVLVPLVTSKAATIS
jgi:hypothetical protein